MRCELCGKETVVRVDMQEGAYGPVCRLTCEGCYAADVKERREEGRRFNYKPDIVRWEDLEPFTER